MTISRKKNEATKMNFRINFRTFLVISNMSIISLHIKDLEMIDKDRNYHDFHSILSRNNMIRFMTTIENINLVIFSRITRIIRMTQTRLILISLLFIQKSHRIKMILTDFKNHFLTQIKTSTTINLDLIHSGIFHSRMIHKLIRFVRVELRDSLSFRRDRMNSIEETTNIRAKFIMQR